MKIKYLLLTLVALFANPLQAGSFGPCDLELNVAGFSSSTCAKSKLPLDYAGNVEGSVELAIRKFTVEESVQRRGQIWLIHGGPGEPGAGFYPFIEVFRAAFEGFDLIVPDHRGTGESTRLCPAEESLESEAGYAMANSEWGACIGSMFANPERTKAFSITNAANDLAALIEQYREPGEVYVYAVSYGTQLTLRMMQVSESKLDGIILDGLIPPESMPEWDLSYRTALVDDVGRSLLSEKSIGQYQQLLASETNVWHDVIGSGDIRQFMGTLLSFPELRERIPDLIDELVAGHTDLLTDTMIELREAHHRLAPYPQSEPSIPLVMLISGSENNSRRNLSAETVAAEAKDALFIHPLPGLLASASAPFYDRDNYFGQVPERLPRTLIIHGTLDPSTPYKGAKLHAELLDKAGDVRFSTVIGGAHFLPVVAPECFIKAASAFVSTDEVPEHCDSL
ncbi:alpha/beta hydrolase [Aliidiomarina maris]|uniref:Alpha/beta hydrolase family protein n=1 Tax=Aliidiomarina maris TaxID=531312 RepID=A0A327WRN8_9GAMM|nr:alpha/beta hydrolase [Aliidiomarina maris]RAJ93336.1 alpha/beta hydrolase family protein [Aliidiomarina maris]